MKVLSLIKTKTLKELQAVLFDHYHNKLTIEADEFWENHHWDNSQMEEIMYGQNRMATQ